MIDYISLLGFLEENLRLNICLMKITSRLSNIKNTGVWSIECAYNKRFWIYSGSRKHFFLFPCYQDLNDNSTLEWMMIHKPTDNHDD